MPNVKAVEIDFPAKTATIEMDSGQSTDRESVENALRAGGYSVGSFSELTSEASSP